MVGSGLSREGSISTTGRSDAGTTSASTEPSPRVAEATPRRTEPLPPAIPEIPETVEAEPTEEPRVATSAIDRAKAVAILPFTNLTQGVAASDLGPGLTEAVSTRLADLDSVMIVSSEHEAGWVVGGGVQRLGDTVRVTARVVDTRDGDIVRAVKVDGTASELARVRGEVATAIEDGIVEALGLVATPVSVRAPASDRIAIRPFSNVSQMPADADIAQAIFNAVADRLGVIDTVSVVAEESDATWVIAGGIQRVGNIVRVTATLIDTGSGSVVRAIKVDGVSDQLAELQSQVASELSDGVREVTS